MFMAGGARRAGRACNARKRLLRFELVTSAGIRRRSWAPELSLESHGHVTLRPDMGRHIPRRDMAWTLGADAPRIGALSFSALLLAAFFSVPYLPMVDMPQHAAQISIWLHLHDPRWAEFQIFE